MPQVSATRYLGEEKFKTAAEIFNSLHHGIADQRTI